MGEQRGEFKDALRMTEAELLRVVTDRASGQGDSGVPRGNARATLGAGMAVPAEFEQPGGNKSRVLLRAIDISPVGVGALHGGFVHMGTKATLYFQTPNGGAFVVEGEVQRATHLKGRVHELGIAFAERVNVASIIGEELVENQHCAVIGAIREVGGVAKRLAAAAATASSPVDVEAMIVEAVACWGRVLELESAAGEDESAQQRAAGVANSARLLAEAVERGASPDELKIIFAELNASMSGLGSDGADDEEQDDEPTDATPREAA